MATPLELLFDLTFVVAFGIAANEFAHMLAENHVGAGLLAFSFAMFSICWAWINFSWFASAYDTDDWIYRVMTMLQMVGVIILALGLPQMFASIEHGDHVDNTVMVAGYVVMRIALVGQWLRAAKQDPDRRSACLTYAAFVTVAQIGWIASIFLHTSLPVTFAIVAVLIGFELLGPFLAEKRMGGTPWHAHHIAERYGLLTIIALGEGVVGTVASLSAVVGAQGWTCDAVFVAVAGIGLTFGMWWVYFIVPQSRPAARPSRAVLLRFGYLHIVVFGAIVATGAGLHAAAYYIEHHSKLGSVETVLSVAIPVGDLHRGGLSALRMVGADAGRVPSAAPGAHRGGAGGRGVAGRRRHLDGQLPADRHAGADGHRRRIRTARSPARRRSDREEPATLAAELASGFSCMPSGYATYVAVRGCAPRAQRVKKAARVHVMPASAATDGAFRWRSTTMPKTTKRGTAKKSELPSTLQKSPAKAQRTFAKAHELRPSSTAKVNVRTGSPTTRSSTATRRSATTGSRRPRRARPIRGRAAADPTRRARPPKVSTRTRPRST